MKAPVFMVVAGEPSGDANAAGLVKALRERAPEARFIGAGGPKMAEAGVSLAFQLTGDATIGPVDALKKLSLIRRRRQCLADLARRERPDAIILVDFYSFNRPWIHSIRREERRPKIIQYTSPQVWASRPSRAEKMAQDLDLLLCFFPFEKEWYARRGTKLRVELVGHPMFDHHTALLTPAQPPPSGEPIIVLLPGSRKDELKRHLPVMLAAARKISQVRPARFKLVAADESAAVFMRAQAGSGADVQVGRLAEALSTATLAITKTGTISLECAFFGVPTLALYKTSLLFYLLARMLVSVKYLSMPNILADAPVFPEFIQGEAAPDKLAQAAIALLDDPSRREAIRVRLREIIQSLGGPGAAKRAADLIMQTVQNG